MKSIRVSAFATHPIQYQVPIWRGLARSVRIELEVIFETNNSANGYLDQQFGRTIAWDVPLLSGYAYSALPEERYTGLCRIIKLYDRLTNSINQKRPEVVLITAYSDPFSLIALLVAKSSGAGVVMRHEASDVAIKRTWTKNLLRTIVLRQLYQYVDEFAFIGTEARLHLLRHGVPDRKLNRAPYCVDTSFFEGQVRRWTPLRAELRHALGIGSSEMALVFSGKLIPKKDPILVIEAISRLPRLVKDRIHFIVIGDGELKGEIEKIGRLVLGRRLHLLGFLNQTEIGRGYACGDCLILPSREGAGETWGLVVNEALQFGLGVIVSEGVGCGVDLVNKHIGSRFISGDADSLAKAILAACDAGITGRGRLSEECRKSVAEFDSGKAVEGLAKSIYKVARKDGVII
jgi:glycosyltransferase involved in cell wall biosynthesis